MTISSSRNTFLRAALFALMLMPTACRATSTSDDTENGGGSSEDGAGGAGGGGSDATTVSAVGGSTTSSSDSTTSSTGTGGNDACNDLQNTGSEVPVEVSDAPPPEMLGGTIVDGDYHMTRFVRHPRSNPVPFAVFRETDHFENGIHTSIEQPDGVGEEFRFSVQLVLEGNTMHREVVCADVGPGPGFTYDVKYTATDTEIVIVDPDDVEITYSRQ